VGDQTHSIDVAFVLASQLLIVEVLRRPLEPGLATAVGVVHQSLQLLAAAAPDGHLQGVQGQVGAQGPGYLPAHHVP
jgi:hypothetical protein